MENKSEYITGLSKELLDDIELSKLNSEQLLLKTSRLARLNQDEKISAFIDFELRGYNSTDEISLYYMNYINRWTNKEKKEGYWYPLATVEANITASELELSRLAVPNMNFSPSSANPGEYVTGFAGANVNSIVNVQTNILLRINNIRNEFTKLKTIHTRVYATLHEYITNTYHTKIFSGYSESIFDSYKKDIDSYLASQIPEILIKISSVYDRLNENTEESISQALTTMRRVLNGFIDKLYPPTDQVVIENGNEIKLDKDKYLNRLTQFVNNNVESKSRKERLRQSARNINEKLSAGVHDKVDSDEARALMLNLFILIGEIVHINNLTTAST